MYFKLYIYNYCIVIYRYIYISEGILESKRIIGYWEFILEYIKNEMDIYVYFQWYIRLEDLALYIYWLY